LISTCCIPNQTLEVEEQNSIDKRPLQVKSSLQVKKKWNGDLKKPEEPINKYQEDGAWS
jgi:hypothetical protein